MKGRMAILLTAGVLLGAPPVLRGQAVDGSVLGTITDATGAAVPGAKVSVTEVGTNSSRATRSNDSGNYVFADLTPGTYTVSAEVQGFKKEVQEKVPVLVNTTVRVDLQLQPGEVIETVNVVAGAPMLQTDRSDTGRKIDAIQVENLPIVYNNHNFQGLLNLVPGTTRAFRPHSQFFNSQDSLSTQVNGNSRLGNNLQLEGIDDNERTGLLQVYIPPMEAIQTVDVTTSDYEAELGRAGGAVTNVILKSGANDFHGEAYAFNRLSALQARNFFDRGPNGRPFHMPVTVYNYDGFSLGGPIKKNKVFFFGDYLHISDHRGQSDLFTLPTADFRGGDFRAVTSTAVCKAKTAADCNIYDPATGNPDGSGRQIISCHGVPNTICPDRFDPVALKILNLIRLPNSTSSGNPYSQNFITSSRLIKTTHTFDMKVDQNPNENNHVSYRFSYTKPVVTDPPSFGFAGGPHGGGFQGTGTQKTYVPGVNWDHIFSPSLIVESRFGVERYRNDSRQSDYGKNDSDALGIPGVNTEPFTSGLASVNIGGYSNPLVGYSASLPWVRSETNIDFVNHWTKTKGNHTVKWGVDVRRVRDDLLQTQTFNPRGTFNFNDGVTSIPGAKTSFANDFASFLLGIPNQVGRDLPIVFPAYRQTWFFAFGQDKWQVSPKLTMDLGLRWELYPPATPHFAGGFSNYDPNTNSLVVAGVGGNPRNLGMETRYRYFAPRFGVAYRLSANTVVRSGFGISYEPFPDNTYAYNFPVKQNNAFNASNSFSPALLPDGTPATFAKGFPPPLPAVIPSNGIIPANTALLLNQDYVIIPRNFRNPYVESWNFALQRALPRNFTFEAAYVGNHGVDIATQYNINADLVPGAGVKGEPLFRLYGRKAATTLFFVGTSTNYNALQVKFDRRSGNLLLTTAYTYSKSLGITDEDGGFAWYINPRRSYARAGFDRTHAFVQSYIYQLPFGKGQHWLTSGAAAKVLGGWQVTGILTLMTGAPLFFNASGKDLNSPGNAQTANISGPFKRLYGVDTQPWFDTSVFSQPAGAGVFGSLGRNVFAGPGFFNLDAALFRKVRLSEKLGLELRAEGFSATNTPQFGNPDTDITHANFGLIKGAGGGRSVDFGARITF